MTKAAQIEAEAETETKRELTQDFSPFPVLEEA